jgi:hypothetical protein
VLYVAHGFTIPVLKLVAGHDSASEISQIRLNRFFEFKECYQGVEALSRNYNHFFDGVIVKVYGISQLIQSFNFFTLKNLRSLHEVHHLRFAVIDTKSVLAHRLLEHQCGGLCNAEPFFYLFDCRYRERHSFGKRITRTITERLSVQQLASRSRNYARANKQVREKALQAELESLDRARQSYATVPDDKLYIKIIREWQKIFKTDNFQKHVCASCGEDERRTQKNFDIVQPDSIDLTLLQNNVLFSIRPELVPTSYDFELYNHALLDPEGLYSTTSLDRLLLCKGCHSDVKKGKMPDLALANWFYYAYDKLPVTVCEAFQTASIFEKMLVSRCHASRIINRFSDNPQSTEFGGPSITSQRYNQGNVMVVPLDVFNLNHCLPPSPDQVHDTMCALFVGQEKPTPENLAKLGPLLIRRSRVKTMLEFLTSKNIHYMPSNDFDGISLTNLDSLTLSAAATSEDDDSVSSHMNIEHHQVSSESAEHGTLSAGYTDRDDIDECDRMSHNTDVLMENVSYTEGDVTSESYQRMRVEAMQHCLSGGKYIRSQRGTTAVQDFYEPALLTWLFPHLDPFAIGGFFDTRRRRPVTLERQLQHLLLLHDSPFEKDPSFAFIFYNILQKCKVVEGANFRVKEGEHINIVRSLLEMQPERLEALAKKFRDDPYAQASTNEEQGLMRTLEKLQLVCKDLPGSAAYKQCRRNEIRSLIHRFGSPAFFVTINPSDVDHPLVRLFAGDEISLEDAEVGVPLDKFQRKILVSKNPGAAALAFDKTIRSFLDVILRHGTGEEGLLGRSQAYYGMVETQGKGTLHCHFLIWIEGHLSPQTLRHQMATDGGFKERIFRWLESLITCELLSTKEPVFEQNGEVLSKPTRPRGVPHPTTRPAPRIPNEGDFDWETFKPSFDSFVEDVATELNWHQHGFTCWKYLKLGDPKDDAHCRMRITGEVHPVTDQDPETESIRLRRLHPRISRYNDLISFLIKCNNDIQFIGSGEAAQALIYYVTNYITKENLPTHAGFSALAYALKRSQEQHGPTDSSNRTAKSLVTKSINAMMGKKEISHQLVMAMLIGGGDYYTSHKYGLLHWGAFDRLIRLSMPDSTQDRTEVGDARSQGATLSPLGHMLNDEFDNFDEDNLEEITPPEMMFLNFGNGPSRCLEDPEAEGDLEIEPSAPGSSRVATGDMALAEGNPTES